MSDTEQRVLSIAAAHVREHFPFVDLTRLRSECSRALVISYAVADGALNELFERKDPSDANFREVDLLVRTSQDHVGVCVDCRAVVLLAFETAVSVERAEITSAAQAELFDNLIASARDVARRCHDHSDDTS